MRRAALVAGLLLLASAGRAAGGPGSGFGDDLALLAPARDAGAGNVPLEDPWLERTQLEAGTILVGPGPRWFTLGGQGGVGSSLRLTGQLMTLQTPALDRTTEQADGTFGGAGGSLTASEWGGQLGAQWTWLAGDDWRVAGVARATGLLLKLPDVLYTGAGLEVGAAAERRYEQGAEALTAWAAAGPFGSGAGLAFAGRAAAGASWRAPFGWRVFGRETGYLAGGEAAALTTGGVTGAAGAAWWIGAPGAAGVSLVLRAGGRAAAQSAQNLSPTGGLGLAWRDPHGWQFAFDYALAPLGDLGLLQFATLTVRPPGGDRP